MLGETFAHDLCLFYNDLELCAKTARYNGHFLILPLIALFLQRLYCMLNRFIELVRNEQYMFER